MSSKRLILSPSRFYKTTAPSSEGAFADSWLKCYFYTSIDSINFPKSSEAKYLVYPCSKYSGDFSSTTNCSLSVVIAI